jgi:hypothetical protein
MTIVFSRQESAFLVYLYLESRVVVCRVETTMLDCHLQGDERVAVGPTSAAAAEDWSEMS